MRRNFFREWYLLPRGEQRALLVAGVLLFCSILVRLTVSLIPEKPPPEMDRFDEECRAITQHLNRPVISPRKDPAGHAVVISSGEAQSRPRVPPVDINRADSAALLPLPGIGPVLAGRIIRFRNLLGGFAFVDQLQEVYGLSRETFLAIRGNLSADPADVRKLDLDSASFRDLLRHPYLDMEQVKSFVRYRDVARPPVTIMQLRENHIWPDSVIRRIKPYLVD